jgi:hypothetical protein
VGFHNFGQKRGQTKGQPVKMCHCKVCPRSLTQEGGLIKKWSSDEKSQVVDRGENGGPQTFTIRDDCVLAVTK